MAKDRKKMIRLILQGAALLITLAVLAFVLIAYVTTYGWGSQNRVIDSASTSNDMMEDRRSAFLEYDAYKFDIEAGRPVKIPQTEPASDENGIVTMHMSMVMNDYDMIFRKRNEKTPLIIRFKLSEGNYEAGERLRIGLYRDLSNRQQGRNYLSDVAYFKCAVIGTDVIAEDASDAVIYNSAVAYFETGAGSSLYQAEFEDASSGSVQTTMTAITNSLEPTGGVWYIYFYVNYDEPKVAAAVVGHSLTQMIELYTDITMFRIEDIIPAA